MGVKTTLVATTLAPAHVAAAAAAGQSAGTINACVKAHIDECVVLLKALVAHMQVGDPNIATINAQITALA